MACAAGKKIDMRTLFAAMTILWLATILSAREFTVLVYNVENLTGANGRTLSDDYRPLRYSRMHLLNKMNNIAKVVAQFDEGRGPDLILFQEVERDISADQYTFDHPGMLRHYADTSIEDMLGRDHNPEIARLPVEALLLKTFEDRGLRGYRVVAADDAIGPAGRKKITHLNVLFTRFVIGAVDTYLLPDAPATVEVQLEVDGHPLYVFNNHWRKGPLDPVAEKARVKAARQLRERLDEILGTNPSADIIVAGDFNTFHDQKARFNWRETALDDALRVRSDELVLRSQNADLYNLWYELPQRGRGSEKYHGEWSTFMQMIVSRGMYDFRGVQYVDNSFSVGAFAELNMTEEGEPYRWSFAGGGRGFSEHFPIAARFRTVTNNRSDQYVKLPPRPPVSLTTVR
jgi:endonuclease/exonuclease/phosphatase family metal-dependent hydrolase